MRWRKKRKEKKEVEMLLLQLGWVGVHSGPYLSGASFLGVWEQPMDRTGVLPSIAPWMWMQLSPHTVSFAGFWKAWIHTLHHSPPSRSLWLGSKTAPYALMWEFILIDRKHSCLLDPHKPGNPGSARREVPIPLWPHKLSWGISFRVPSGIEIQATFESLEHLSNIPQPFPISASWFSASCIGLHGSVHSSIHHVHSRYHFVSLTSL